MYDLGENFRIDLSNCLSNPECVFKGNKYRITVLTERLVRIEYSEKGVFNNNLTLTALNRNFEKPKFMVEQNDTTLKITTRYFELRYEKEKAINSSKNLRIDLKETDRTWYYGHPEVRNFGYVSHTDNNNPKYKKSLYSIEGFVSIDDSNTNIILENGSVQERPITGLDIYVFLYNKDFFYCLNDYFKLTGYPMLLPRFALGIMLTKNTQYDQYSLLNSLQKYEDHNIPISSFILNNWESNLYEFSNKFNEIDKLINYLISKNIRIGLTISDLLSFKSNIKNYDLFEKYLPKDNSGQILFNMHDPKIVDAYLKFLIHPLNYIGIKYYDINSSNNERSYLLSYYLTRDSANKRVFTISKSTNIPSHRYSILYSDRNLVDWSSLKNIIKTNVSASNMGLSYWCHDFGGTTGGIEDKELYCRFVELGTFSPIFRLGSDGSKYYKREPWKWDISTNQIATYYMKLRYRLIPYIYTEFYKYHKYGKPLIEPLYYRYPELYDDPLYNDSYFFGSTFYLNPIIEKKNSLIDRTIHKVFIPEGVWFDYFTGKKYNGNKKYVCFYKDSEYPVFVKAGAIIPMSKVEYNDLSVPKKLEIQVFPGDSNTYSIYEDDGETTSYEKGNYAITNIEFQYKENNYTLTIMPTQGNISAIPSVRDYSVRFKNTKPTANVRAYQDGKEINIKKSRKSSDLIVDLSGIPTKSQVTLICKGDNIEIESKKIISDDIVSIISDLPIKTIVKERIDNIIFSDKYDLRKKRIEIKKLANGKDYLQRKYIDLFLKLLEYINEV